MPELENPNLELARFAGEHYDDPLGFVIAFFPWDTDETIQLVELKEPWKSRYPNCKYGPDAWACEILDDIGRQSRENHFDGKNTVKALRYAIASGHGAGKSTLTAWIVCWIMSTRPLCRGTVTANTAAQLETRTWAQITTWAKRLINAHWFEISSGKGSMRMFYKGRPRDWFVSAQTCREENSESFAGQHAAGSTSFYIFDEASAVPDTIWEVAEGGLTDGEPMMFVFGNPTRNTGKFFECFHKDRARWVTRQIDSRSVSITNKDLLEEWRNTYGEESDFFKVRVKGEFPSTSSTQFISTAAVNDAMARPSGEYHGAKIAIVGADIAMYGDDKTCFVTRVGREVIDIKTYAKRGLEVCSFLQEHVNDLYRRLGFEKVYVFMDAGGVGAAHVDYMKKNGWEVTGINFGGAADDSVTFKNKRAEMWARMKTWVEREEAVLPDRQDLKDDMTAPEYSYDTATRLVLEPKDAMKRRGLASPDIADALALTFAQFIYEPPEQESIIQSAILERARASRRTRFYDD